MHTRNFTIYITVILLFYLFSGCTNETKVEIISKKEVSSAEREKSITPLPAPQRLRLLPADMSAEVPSDLESLSTASPEKMTTHKENPQMVNSEIKKDDGNSSVVSTGGFEKLELIWTTPTGWQEDTTKPMRIVSFKGAESSEWECYISVLMSQAGGVEANLKRWASQMGRGDIDSQAIIQLPDISILGKQCKMLDITGTYVDMQGTTHENYRLLGAVCPLENKTLFVKMTGPEKEVAIQKDNFIKLCNSIAPKN